jgi:hypothetical protein
MLQSPQAWWNTGPMEEIIEEADVDPVPDESKYERLIELVRETEKTEISDYMGTMSEVNSLVYDLVTSDESRSHVIIKDRSVTIPACYVCRALEVIGTNNMAAKVESERVLLEAIAVSEGCFGEKHRGAFHFRVKLFLLCEHWGCRAGSTCGLLLQVMLLALENVPSGKVPDLLSNLPDFLEIPDPTESARCSWFQGSSRGSSLSTSSQQLSTLSIQDDTVRHSPRTIWGMISVIIDRLGLSSAEDPHLEFEPILELILDQGPNTTNGSSYFWMTTFILAMHGMWGAIYRSKAIIENAASESLPGSTALKSCLKDLIQSKSTFLTYRLQERAAAVADDEFGLEKEGYGSLLVPHRPKFDDITKLKGPLNNLEELGLVLAEVSLAELERSDCSHAFPIFPAMISVFKMYNLLCRAARLGSSTLITKLSERFGNITLEDDVSFINLLDISGSVPEWADESPLYLAISSGYYLTVEALLNAGADPDGPDEWESAPLNLAADAGHDDIVELLIRRGATMFYPGDPILKCMIGSSDQELHARFLEDLLEYWYNEMRPLLISMALVGKFERYELLDIVSEAIRKNLASKRNKPPWFLRSILNEYDREYLFDFLNDDEDTGRGLELILNVLTGIYIEQQARIVFKTALFGAPEALNEMLQPTKTSECPTLHTLVSRNAPNALSVFLDFDPNLAALDSQGNTALHIAAAGNRVACARQLLKLKIDVDVENNDGQTARQIAVEKGHTEISEEIDLTSVVAVIEGSVGMG